MASEQVDILKRVPLLSGLDDRQLERLGRSMKERTFPAGSTVTSEGATGTGFFVIADGTASVTVGGEERTRLAPGDYFGEIALIDQDVRSASIAAETDLRCYGLTPWEFRPFVEEHPEVAWTLLRTLAQRLRAAQSG